MPKKKQDSSSNKEKNENFSDVEELMESLQTRYGEGAIMKLGDRKKINVDTISSGSFSLDIALGVGGLPRGRVIEIYGPESSGKCITQDSIVFSEWGMFPINSFGETSIPGFQKEETFVYSEHSYEKASHFYNDGERDTVKVETNFGFTIEGTPNHRIRVMDKNGNYLFRRLDELKKIDRVAIQRGQQFFGGGVDLNDYKYNKNKNDTHSKEFKPPKKITKDLALLMGYLISDGTLTDRGMNKNNIQITVGDAETENDIKKICQNIFGEKPKATPDKRTKSTKRLSMHGVRARNFLNYAGVGWWQAENKEIPWSILAAPKKIVSAFISALYEGDGGFSSATIEYCTKSPKLAHQIQITLLNFGIVAKKKTRKIKGNEYYYIYIDGQKDKEIFFNEINFRSSRKRDALEKYITRKKKCRNQTNTDSIPNINSLLEQFFNRFNKEVRNTNRSDWDVVYDYLPAPRGKEVGITYHRLDRILNHFKEGRNLPEYQRLEELKNLGFFYDKIKDISKSKNHVVDFTIPKTATFFANGFVNHNTTLSLHAIAEAQKKGGKVAFIDAEHALDPEYAKKIGVKFKDLIISQPDSGDEALNILEDIVKSGAIDIVVVDSVAALTPKEELEGEMGDKHVGLQARLMSQALRKITAVTGRTGTIVIFINQIRMKIGVMYGSPEITPGGRALKFYSSVRLDIRRKAQIKRGDEVVGNRTNVKVVKNKVAPPFRIAEFDIFYGKGISYESDVLNSAVKYGVVKRKGSSYQYNGESVAVGFDKARKKLQEDKKLLKEIEKETKKEIEREAKESEND